MGLFKKKPGGTLIGNLLRLGASYATGGILGSGANRIPLPDTSPIAPPDTSPVAPIITSPVKAVDLSGQQISGSSVLTDFLGALHGVNKTLNEGLEVKPKVSLLPTLLVVGALIGGLWWIFGKGRKHKVR